MIKPMPESLTGQSKALAGKVAVVTGGNKGIGRAICHALGSAGASVAIAARNPASMNAVVKELERLGAAGLAQECDVRDEKQIQNFTRAVEKSFGGVDILVNNAGIYKTEPVRGHRLSIWNEVMATNLTGAMLMSSHLIERMIERKWGRIINISSISGKVAEMHGSAYSASKFGLIGFTQSLALEVAKYNITANAICPGWVMTDMARSQLSDEFWCREHNIDPAESEEIARLSSPQERFVQPEEVASLALYLCSESAVSITGQAINICGGLSLH